MWRLRLRHAFILPEFHLAAFHRLNPLWKSCLQSRKERSAVDAAHTRTAALLYSVPILPQLWGKVSPVRSRAERRLWIVATIRDDDVKNAFALHVHQRAAFFQEHRFARRPVRSSSGMPTILTSVAAESSGSPLFPTVQAVMTIT